MDFDEIEFDSEKLVEFNNLPEISNSVSRVSKMSKGTNEEYPPENTSGSRLKEKSK
jgi:hypothetical protein